MLHRSTALVLGVAGLCVFTEACSSANGSSTANPSMTGGTWAASSGGNSTLVSSTTSSRGTEVGGSSDITSSPGSGGTSGSGGAGGTSNNATGGTSVLQSSATGGHASTGGQSSVAGHYSTGGQVDSGGQAGSGGQTGAGGQTPLASGGNSGGHSGSGGNVASGGTTNITGGASNGGASNGGASNGGASNGGASNGGASSGGASGTTCPSIAITSGNTTRTIQVGGTSRTYVLHVPTGYTGKTAVPLLVDFHPHGSTGPSWQSSSPYPSVVDKEGVISAYPSAIGDWNVGPCCADGVDDVGFAKALVNQVKGIACIDSKRVYAAGFSMGGGMTNFVACNAADVFAAFAPAAFDLLQEIVADCKPGRPVTVASFRGTADPYVPYAGGLSNLVRPINFLGAVNTMNKWASFNGCTGSAADIGNGCQGYAASQCQGGAEVVLCTKQGGGHEAANASLIWPVIKRHSLP